MTESAYLFAAFAFFVGTFIYGLLAVLVWQKSVKGEKDWVFLLAMTARCFAENNGSGCS